MNALRRTVRQVGLTWVGWGLLMALMLALGLATGYLLTPAHAQEADQARYSPSSRGTRPEVARWRPLLEQYDDWDVDTGLRMVDCESAGDPSAINPTSGAAGLTQLLGWAWLARRLFGSGDVLNPWINVAVAHVLWLDSGGTFRWHWASSRGCWS